MSHILTGSVGHALFNDWLLPSVHEGKIVNYSEKKLSLLNEIRIRKITSHQNKKRPRRANLAEYDGNHLEENELAQNVFGNKIKVDQIVKYALKKR